MPILLDQSRYQVFIDAILAALTDRTNRLVLADFLEDAGDPRGPLLRLSSAAEAAAAAVPVSLARADLPDPPGGPPVGSHPVRYNYDPTYRLWLDAPILYYPDRKGWTRLLTIALFRDLFGGFGNEYAPVWSLRYSIALSWAGLYSPRTNFADSVMATSLVIWELYSCRLVRFVRGWNGGRINDRAHPLSVAYANSDSGTYEIIKYGTYPYYGAISRLYQIAGYLHCREEAKTPLRPWVAQSHFVYRRWRAAAKAFAAATKGFTINELSVAERQAGRPVYGTDRRLFKGR